MSQKKTREKKPYSHKPCYSRETIDLAESIGDFIEYWGFKNIQGRIWVIIYLSKDPIDAPILIETLEVSKGLVSTAIKTLLDYKLIEEVDFGGKRSKYYRARVCVIEAIHQVLSQRELLLVQDIQAKFEKAQKHCGECIDHKKLKQLKKIISLGDLLLRSILRFGRIDFAPWKKL